MRSGKERKQFEGSRRLLRRFFLVDGSKFSEQPEVSRKCTEETAER